MNANGISHPRISVILHSHPLGMTSIFAVQPLPSVFYFKLWPMIEHLKRKMMVDAQDASFHFRPTKWLPEEHEGNEYVFDA